ncbi:(2Fe-2S)-binding protein [Rhodococcus sovatensis]|uniref:(2Fe-2S)-binding protein n=1 Tax=Rhodococcus sovatensis TaxID=1805840 RepID=A0ABZ2PES0_9NOCA
MTIYAEAAKRVPGLEEYLQGPFDLPSSSMLDPDWMRARVVETGRRWNCADARVNGTLWWYSASSTLAFVAVATVMVTGEAADPSLEGARCFLRSNGYLGGVMTDRTIDAELMPEKLNSAFTGIIGALSAASGARSRALWAIGGDSIANRSLDVGAALGDRSLGSAFAEQLVERMTAPLPAPRFVDVGGRRFTRRCSCCLLYLTEGADKCTSCPRRSPSDRLRGLEAAARY